MLYTIDRVQFAHTNQKYYFFEFMEVTDINMLTIDNQLPTQQQFWERLFNMISEVEQKKVNFLLSFQHAIRVFIFYQRDLNKYIRIELDPFVSKTIGAILNFSQLQQWFRGLNNIDGQSNSKGLGAARDANIDSYVNGLLKSLYNNDQFQDDNGLILTKDLLNGDSTKGFDLDLFQFVPSTNEYIVYEFLKRENQYINNIKAHPMRYSWTNRWNDNKQKYISLWNISQHLGGRLILVNYSDNLNEKVSLIEVKGLDINKGITAETKYCMSRHVFLGWLHDMNHYSSKNNDYFSDFKKAEYDESFSIISVKIRNKNMALSFLTYLSKGEKYMPGTWSISTTVRNPERIILFLRVLSRFEGETFDPDTQALFFKELIKTKLYLPNGISDYYKQKYEDPEEFSVAEVKDILSQVFYENKSFNNNQEMAYAMRGRTAVSNITKMGLAIAKESMGTVKITELGKKFLDGEIDLVNVFFRYFMKWQLPNPIDKGYKNFNIVPFTAVMHVINKVNIEWRKSW